ncbi:rhomboid family intramembrane serine protease [Kushneria aurantia]|uniref:Rhomboid family intramembrane serine protease n=1 Tax=Kushneria aurantia TaxID=504092 RepID=A0ABV6G2X5_9GAMM|nr:rhomboid family intramembrane serine protease [Kushneria aurantia]
MPQALRFSADTDLDALRRALWAHRIGHHFEYRDGDQILWLIDDAQLEAAHRLVARWQRGESLALESDAKGVARSGSVGGALAAAPVTAALVALCVAVYGLQLLSDLGTLSWLAIVPFSLQGEQLYAGTLAEALRHGQIWRLFSPAFLHFSPMHLIFNLLWLWFFGRQVEVLQGRMRLLALLLIAMVVSNLAQYATGTVLFGGMSGVVYALVGFVWLYARLVPDSGFSFPQMLVIFMIGWLVLCMTPLADWIGFGNIANEAHLGGLLLGLIAGALASRRPVRRGSI